MGQKSRSTLPLQSCSYHWVGSVSFSLQKVGGFSRRGYRRWTYLGVIQGENYSCNRINSLVDFSKVAFQLFFGVSTLDLRPLNRLNLSWIEYQGKLGFSLTPALLMLPSALIRVPELLSETVSSCAVPKRGLLPSQQSKNHKPKAIFTHYCRPESFSHLWEAFWDPWSFHVRDLLNFDAVNITNIGDA